MDNIDIHSFEMDTENEQIDLRAEKVDEFWRPWIDNIVRYEGDGDNDDISYINNDYSPDIILNESFKELGELLLTYPNNEDSSSQIGENAETQMFNINSVRSNDNIFFNQSGADYDLFRVINTTESHNERFNTRQFKYDIQLINNVGNFSHFNMQIEELFNQLYEYIGTKADPIDRVGMTFDHPELDFLGYVPFMKFEDFSPDTMLHLLHHICQSNTTVQFDREFTIAVIIAKVPVGGVNITNQYLEKKRCVKFVFNSDNMCAIRSIIIAIAYLEKDPKRYGLTLMSSKLLEQQTNKVAKNLNILNKTCTIYEIKRLEQYFKYYQISIVNDKGDFIYIGQPNKKYLYLWYTSDHYNAVISIRKFLKTNFFCDFCKKKYDHGFKHICEANCKSCNRSYCAEIESRECNFCKISCKSEKCEIMHINSYCKVAKKCEECGRFKSTKHVCSNQRYCLNCKAAVPRTDHRCFVLTEGEKKPKKCNLAGYIFFDYEATQEHGDHIANLICALKMCVNCFQVKANDLNCPNGCGKYQFNTNYDFCEWLFNQEYYTAIAHNMKGYDGVFIMNYIVNNIIPMDPQPSVIVQGSKLLCIRFKDVRIIDSFSFIPISLAQFSSAFGIDELKKGFFPHKFNKECNQNMVFNEYPPQSDYGVEFFTKKKLDEFNLWYGQNRHKQFDFNKELVEYCWSDVLLLSEGCFKFRAIVMELTQNKIDPFQKSITIASMCHLIYRTSMLKPKCLPYIPEKGYDFEKNHSFKSITWLNFLIKTLGLNIRHARNGGEQKIGNYFLDGYDSISRTGYEFHGCYYHGCPKCFAPDTFNIIQQTTMKIIHLKHQDRIKYLKLCCSNLVEIWECEYDELVKSNKDLQKLIEEQPITTPLQPRDSLFGGRTNALKLHYKCSNDEEIHYVDFTSLYPYVQKYERYPVGHPTIIKDDFQNIKNYFGIIKCRIIPPRNLYIPVLPLKINDKLVFTLCRKCAENRDKSCTHSQKERYLTGTWISMEIHKAIDLGYIIDHIYEIWHWEESKKYNSATNTPGIFTDYINLFLKGKQEASGYPSNINTDFEKEKYIKDYYDREGIFLDRNKIEKNAAKRFVFKLALNSHWGRLGMNTERTNYKQINKPSDWFSMLTDDQYQIQSADFTHPDVIQVYYKKTLNEGSNETSVPHAAFVTSYARLKLYTLLESLGKSVLYFDTDSVIYVWKKGEQKPQLGNYLGDLTNELEDGDYIEEFVSAGPKNYAYTTKKGKSNCTVKGFTLNSTTQNYINFDSIKDIVIKNQSKTIEAEHLLFTRDKVPWTTKCTKVKKIYGFVYDKRVLFDDLTTLPFGY